MSEATNPKAVDAEIKVLELEALKIKVAKEKAILAGEEARTKLTLMQTAEMEAKVLDVENRKTRSALSVRKGEESRNFRQSKCNHHQGGSLAGAVLNGKGDLNRPPCLGSQLLPDGIFVIHCLRCHKEWRSNQANFAEGNALLNLMPEQQRTPMISDQLSAFKDKKAITA